MNWYKMAQNKKISFDFDGTIALNKWNSDDNDYHRDYKQEIILTPNQLIINLLKQYKSKGYTIFIVSSRIEAYKQEIIDFLNKYNIPYDACYVTNGNYKSDKLKELNVSVHYDDDNYELNALKDTNIQGIKV